MIQHYETLLILSSSLQEEELVSAKKKVEEMIQKYGGVVTREGWEGERKLPFPIRNERYGTYLLVEFDLPSSELSELSKEMDLVGGVLRHREIKARMKTVKEVMEEAMAKERLAKEQEEEGKAKEEAPLVLEKKIGLEELNEKLDRILDHDIIR